MSLQQKIELARPGVGVDQVVYVDTRAVAWVRSWPVGFGGARLAVSQEACAELIIEATPPICCGEAIPVAPARGAFQVFEPRRMELDAEGKWQERATGFEGRRAIRIADAFDLMAAQAARQKRAHPLSAGQVAMGRFYAALTERHACAGVKSSSVEASRGGGNGSNTGFIEAVLRDRGRLDVLHKRIGDGAAMVVRRVRPSARQTRMNIRDRVLVDRICLEGKSVDDVLRDNGWSCCATTRRAAYAALIEALERMMGPVSAPQLSAAHFGDGPASIWN